MQTISQNPITQTQHGAYNAVDIGPSPDPYYYAPEDGTITGVGDSGTCGYRLGMDGSTGAHGFCHNSEIYVKVGDKVKRGQKLAKMGYTGYTQPDDVPAGTHVHWVINRNGVYVYPPSLVNETFKKGANDMYDGKTAEQWYLIANDWHVRADDRQKVIVRLENEVQDLKKRVADLEANPAQQKLEQIKQIIG